MKLFFCVDFVVDALLQTDSSCHHVTIQVQEYGNWRLGIMFPFSRVILQLCTRPTPSSTVLL